MTAFVCILDRSGADLDPAQVRRLTEPLALYGSRVSSVCKGPVAVAVRHPVDPGIGRWQGPLNEPATDRVVALVGSLTIHDKRPADGARDRRPVEADWLALARQAFRQPGGSLFADTTGSFVLVAADPEHCRLSLTRDHLGDLKVYYHLGPRWFVAASEPSAILRHPAVAGDLDEHSVARFLGFRFYHSERSFFSQIKELAPAHRLRVTADDARIEEYWRFRIGAGAARPSPDATQAAFRDHLRRSMAAQTVGLDPPQVAISLSGGLDSTSLAALAPRGIRAFSWHLGAAVNGEERRNIQAVAEHLKIPVHWIDGAGLYPLCDGYTDRFVHPNSPYLNAFAALKHALYRAASAEGCRQVMVGDAGDALYSAQEYWLRDSLTSFRPGSLASLARTLQETAAGDRSARRALRRLVPLPAIRHILPGQRMPWLTGTALSLLPRDRVSPILPAVRWKRRFDLIAGAKHTELESEERRLFAQCGVGRSSPFWHWPLLEMVMRLPAWWYHRDGTSKFLTIEAMRGLLPARVLDSGTVGLLGSIFLRGIESRRSDLREAVFRQPKSDWRRYVKRSWLEPHLQATASIDFGHTILWRVICYELWYRHLLRSG